LRSSFQSPFSQKDLSKSPIEQEPALPLEQKPSFVFDQGKKDDFVLEKKPSFRALQDFEHHWPATVEPVSPPVRLQQLHQVQEDKENAVFCIYIGVVFATYLLFQKENVFFLVDQHAAHERIQFEKNHHSHQNSQKLLQEERFDVADASLLKKRLFWFQTARFDVHFDESQSQIVFLGVPACWQNNQIRIRLKNCLERVLDEQTLEISQVGLDYWVFEEDAMRACKESIRAHQILAPFQAEALFRDLFLTRHPGNCPHGRPTYIEISQNQVEGWFRRQNARSELSW
jgi:DNA mismatch repair protein MutL